MIIIGENEHRIPLCKNSKHELIAIGTVINELTINSGPFKVVSKPHRIFYECVCDCGTITIADSSRLHTAKVYSCGCRMSTINKRQESRICKDCGLKEPAVRFKKWGRLCNKCMHKRYPHRQADHRSKSVKNFVRYRISSIRTRKKHLIEITADDVCRLFDKQSGKCALSGLSLTLVQGAPDVISIDRIDSKIGYTLDNIQLVCMCLNLAKNSFDNNIIIEFLERLKEN